MKAILFRVGATSRPVTRIYCLADDGGRNQVLEFLKGEADDSAVDGMMAVLAHIAESGPRGLSRKVFKSWRDRKTGERIWEIKKGDFRILCFKYEGDRLLVLAIALRKQGDSATADYDRAIGRKRQFDTNQIWRDS